MTVTRSVTKLTTMATAVLATMALSACMTSPSHSNHTEKSHAQHHSSHADASNHNKMMAKNLVQVAQSDENFSILVEAVVAAGLVDTLANTPNLTVFAPTDQAFANLLGELGMTKAELLANKPLLTQVLTYHVIPAKVYSHQVKPGNLTTVQGKQFSFGAEGKITDARGRMANLVATDIKASNGVIHVIDKVILP
ncbi:fasciclin domain-containing protein [Psychrobacter sp. HD31]|uniref:fasciclin domain-containing protein n=1 Tax=Psychrobacter sp. HD31 TaxID=3112003 RepID=UPI003DA67982